MTIPVAGTPTGAGVVDVGKQTRGAYLVADCRREERSARLGLNVG